MRTDELIAQLSDGLQPVKQGAVTRLLLGAILLGIVGSVLVMLTMIGLRHDLEQLLVMNDDGTMNTAAGVDFGNLERRQIELKGKSEPTGVRILRVTAN